MNELKLFDDVLAGLIANLSPKARKVLTVTVAKRLRARQQQRIKRQQAPDGSPYASRKSQVLRKPKGRIKKEMFAKLRTARYIKASGSTDEAVVEFAGRVERMARVHHFGLRDRPSIHSQEMKYEERPLLGFSLQDRELVENAVIACLAK